MDLELSVEVKDFVTTPENLKKELGKFAKQVEGNRILGIAFVAGIEDEPLKLLTNSDVRVLTKEDLLWTLKYWDWPKQDEAVHGMLNYLSHIEQNPKAVARLLEFIALRDPNHSCLDYYTKASLSEEETETLGDLEDDLPEDDQLTSS